MKQLNMLVKSRQIDIEFQDIIFTAKDAGGVKQILKGVSGKFLSGQLTAIMGPSGAGKTSLLNILTGYQISHTEGIIKCNRVLNNRKGALQYRKESSYILQDDSLPDLFTVEEIMMMATNLKVSDLSIKSKEFLIDEILNNLSLITCRNIQCKNLSGGQRKRLSIALELVDNPPIMFLDEPTTGLDSSSSSQCVKMLKDLARGGRTIVCTIHQPSASIYESFDHIYMLAQGKCVFQGASSNTVSFLSSVGFHCPQYHNPADYFLEVVSGDYGDCVDHLATAATSKKWRNIPDFQIHRTSEIQTDVIDVIYQDPEEDLTHKAPSEWARFFILLKRASVQIYRDWTISQLKIVLHLMVGIFLGLTYQNIGQDGSRVISNVGFLLAGLVYLSYTSIMPAVLKFPSEITILKKEIFNNWYKLSTYYAAFLIFDIPLQVIFTATYSITSYFISAQPYELTRYLMVLFIQILLALSSSGFGFVLGAVIDPINGTFFGAISLAVMIVLAGFLILYTHMSKFFYAFTYLSFVSFAVEGLIQALYGYGRSTLSCPEEKDYCHHKFPEHFLRDVGMEKPNYWADVGYLLMCLILFRTITFCLLRKRLFAK